MTELLTAAQMHAIEQAAIDSGEVTGLEMMECAGVGVVEAILEEWPDMAKTPQKAVILCGPGNNGGDGFVVARLLKGRGWEVEVFLYGEVDKLPPDAKVNAERWLEVGEIAPLNFADSWQVVLPRIATNLDQILIDALFGTGLTRPIEEPLQSVLSALDDSLDQCVGHYVAVDIPSGLCANSGKEMVKWPRKVNITVTFHRAKVGHYLNWGPYNSGRVVVKNIGLDRWAFNWVTKGNHIKPDKSEIRAVGRVNALNRPVQYIHPSCVVSRKRSSHKFHHGHALILSGPSARTGAARLAARGALRIGAGVVSLGAPQSAIAECAAQLTAIMLAPIEDGEALAATLQDKRINALCLGPALGLDDRARGLLEVAIGGVEPHPTALDADALTILGEVPELFASLHKNCVLTPHAGEFKRLFPDIMAKLEAPATTGPAYSKVDATREAAARAGCVVLFKGADTVIASPDGRTAINSAHYERAAPWLATAGSGDVLAGFITGLLARGFAPMQAAETAAWLHVECALHFGPGLIAEDIPEQLPAVFKSLAL